MMSEAMARHVLECVQGGISVAFKVGRLSVCLKYIDRDLYYQGVGTFSLKVVSVDIVEGYFRIETEEGVLIGLPIEEASE